MMIRRKIIALVQRSKRRVLRRHCRAPPCRCRARSIIADPCSHDLLSAFKARTGCPVLVNTSFNVRGEPIVCTPEDAFRCFMGSEIELLVAGNCILRKDRQDPRLKLDYKAAFDPD